MFPQIQCPVCKLFLLQGMTLDSHLDTHPKDSVISALVSLTLGNGGTPGGAQASLIGMPQGSMGVPQNNLTIVNSQSTQLIRRTTMQQPINTSNQPYTLVPAQMISGPATTTWPYCLLPPKSNCKYDNEPYMATGHSANESLYSEGQSEPMAEAEWDYYEGEGQESAIQTNQEDSEVQDGENAYPEDCKDDEQIVEPPKEEPHDEDVADEMQEIKTDQPKARRRFRVLSSVTLSPESTLKMQDIIYHQSTVKESTSTLSNCPENLLGSSKKVSDDDTKLTECLTAAKTSVIRMVTSASVPLPLPSYINLEKKPKVEVKEEKQEQEEEEHEEQEKKKEEETKESETLPARSSNFPTTSPRKFLSKTPKKLVVKFKNPIVIHDTPDEVKIEPPCEVEINKVAVGEPSTSAEGQKAGDEEGAKEGEKPELLADIKEEKEEASKVKDEDCQKIEDTPNQDDFKVQEIKAEEVAMEDEKQNPVITVEDDKGEVEKVPEATAAEKEVKKDEEEYPQESSSVVKPIFTIQVEMSPEPTKMEIDPETRPPPEVPTSKPQVFTIKEEDGDKKEEKVFPSSSSSSSSSSSASSSAGTSASSSSSASSSAGTSSNQAEFTAPNSQGFFEEAAGPSRFDYGFTEFLGYNESEGDIFSNDRSVRFSPMAIMNEDLSWEQYTQLESNQNSYVDLDTCRTHSMGVSRAPSADSLNIRTDEKMPAKGEISEQESNGDIDGLWNIPVYPNSDAAPRFSSSYDMSVARESWSLSSDQNNQQDASHIATHIIPKFTSLAAQNGEDQKTLVPTLADLDSSSSFKKNAEEKKKPFVRVLKYPCSICSRSFRLYRQRKYHMFNDHQEFLASERRNKQFRTKVQTDPSAATSTTTSGASLSQSEDDKATSYPTSTFFIDFNIKQMKDKTTITSELQDLVTAFNTKRLYFCMMCKGQYSKIRDYDKHLSIHPAECYSCGKMFKSWKTLLNHLKRHLGMIEYICRLCDKQFSSRQSLMEHERMHTGETPIKCNMCPRTFRRQSNLLQHKNNHHMKIRPRVKDYLCHCGEVFHTKAKFLWHKETHEKIPKGCPFCRERFIHRNSLSRHIRLAHAEKYIELNKETVTCHICEKHYLKTSIKTHMLIHTEQVNFECSICNKSFSTKWNLKMHKWIHASRTAMPFKCSICPKAFIRQSDLQDHINRHKSIKPFTCDYCGCQFGRKYNWLRHTREHITEKQHTCNICGKSFHRAYYLKEHSRSHTNERPYECIICGKTSATKTNHNKHVKIHHARDPLTAEGRFNFDRSFNTLSSY
ncbi:uncharacterized protein LOC129799738 isoform X2 [Phlebotomus papatasi]|uniref:uncharacterized protein LOC129799738 isoform X2 n=1 Tax=Phlebotomus papatasi TaxID=29031 RepID=UPI00248367D0|nr:uncharacterized protein LOC129799738 isoform X2 [Phlebotomus papatasi]